MPSERTLRRPDFQPGFAIHMADGQPWTLPTPGRALVRAGVAPAPGDPEYRATVEALWEAEDEAERLRAELALAILLLGRNYALRPEDYQALLAFRPGDPALAAMQQAVRSLAEAHLDGLRPQARHEAQAPAAADHPRHSQARLRPWLAGLLGH